VTQLYADYRKPYHAQLSLHTYLWETKKYHGPCLWHDTLSVRIPLSTRHAHDYARALDQALQKALQSLSEKVTNAIQTKLTGN
jgi:hypothetical protein